MDIYKTVRAPMALIGLSILLAGCGGNGANLGNNGGSSFFKDIPLTEAEMANIKIGTKASVYVDRVDEKGNKTHPLIPIVLGDTYPYNGIDYITFKHDQPDLGAGDSGSPVLDGRGHTIGAFSLYFGGNVYGVTPITVMPGTDGRGLNVPRLPNELAWFATGLNSTARQQLRDHGIPISNYDPVNAFKAYGRGGSGFDITAGDTFSVVPFEGPLVEIYAIGTATHAVDQNLLSCFGHPLNGDNTPIYPMPAKAARNVQFVNDPVWGSFKLSVPIGDVVGGVTGDHNAGIIVDRAANPRGVEIVINANGKTTVHKLWYYSDLGLESYFFGAGVGSIVPLMFDNNLPGNHPTTVLAVHWDESTEGFDLPDANWSYGASYEIWSMLSEQLFDLKKIEITVGD